MAGPTEADYNRRRRSLTLKIYQEFDERQAQAADKSKAFDHFIKKEWFTNFEERQEDELNMAMQKMLTTFPHVSPKGSSYIYFAQINADKYLSFKTTPAQ